MNETTYDIFCAIFINFNLLKDEILAAKNAQKSIMSVSCIIRQTRQKVIKKGIILKIAINHALNMWLVAFGRKLYQICEHRYNNSN